MGICDGDWTAALNLPLESWYDAAATPDHVPKPDGPAVDCAFEAEDQHLAQSLATAHDRVPGDGFVSRDEDESAGPGGLRTSQSVICANHVGPYRLQGMGFQ